MRTLALVFLATLPLAAQEVAITVRPDAVYVENLGGNLGPMERVFFHVVVENQSRNPVDVQWVRFDVVNSTGVVFSGQYSGQALTKLFDSAIERKRIEPTTRETLTIEPGERKAISDIFMDLPMGFLGDNLFVEVDYKSAGKEAFSKVSSQLRRTEGFSGRLPFDGTWYVASEHGFLDPHKRFIAEAFAYDFVQIGPNGRSFQREGRNNADYWAYSRKVLAAKEGTVVSVREDIVDNVPGETTNTRTPGGNAVVIDHGNEQYGYYAHLKPSSVSVKVGTRVRAGDPIAEVGNSGDSLEPHLHFHVMSSPDPAEADGIPAGFENWKSQAHTRFPAPRQGVLPKGEFVQP